MQAGCQNQGPSFTGRQSVKQRKFYHCSRSVALRCSMDFVTTITTAAGQGKVRIVIALADRERCSPKRCGRCR